MDWGLSYYFNDAVIFSDLFWYMEAVCNVINDNKWCFYLLCGIFPSVGLPANISSRLKSACEMPRVGGARPEVPPATPTTPRSTATSTHPGLPTFLHHVRPTHTRIGSSCLYLQDYRTILYMIIQLYTGPTIRSIVSPQQGVLFVREWVCFVRHVTVPHSWVQQLVILARLSYKCHQDFITSWKFMLFAYIC